jgi:hypothetical protein
VGSGDGFVALGLAGDGGVECLAGAGDAVAADAPRAGVECPRAGLPAVEESQLRRHAAIVPKGYDSHAAYATFHVARQHDLNALALNAVLHPVT